MTVRESAIILGVGSGVLKASPELAPISAVNRVDWSCGSLRELYVWVKFLI